MKLRLTHFSLIAGLLAISCAGSSERSSRRSAPEQLTEIHSMESVEIRVMESHPEQIVVTARGLASSGGWSKPTLVPRGEGAGGVFTFAFVAAAPDGPATQALTPIEATATFTRARDIREVRVVSATNTRSKRLP